MLITTGEDLSVAKPHAAPWHAGRVSTSGCQVKRTSYPRAMRRAIHVAIPTALATLLLLWFLVEEGRTARAERLLHQLPATAKAVVRVDVRSLARDESMLALFDALTGQGELSTIQVECDIDPRTTIDELVVWAGGPDDRPFQTVGLLITGGSIDAERFAQCYRTLVEARGSQVTRLTATNRVVLGSTDGPTAPPPDSSKQVGQPAQTVGAPHSPPGQGRFRRNPCAFRIRR